VSDAEAAVVGRSVRRWVAVVAFLASLSLVGLAAIGFEVDPAGGTLWAALGLAGIVVALASLLRAIVPVERPREESGEKA
jgi:hypothetical protein